MQPITLFQTWVRIHSKIIEICGNSISMETKFKNFQMVSLKIFQTYRWEIHRIATISKTDCNYFENWDEMSATATLLKYEVLHSATVTLQHQCYRCIQYIFSFWCINLLFQILDVQNNPLEYCGLGHSQLNILETKLRIDFDNFLTPILNLESWTCQAICYRKLCPSDQLVTKGFLTRHEYS